MPRRGKGSKSAPCVNPHINPTFAKQYYVKVLNGGYSILPARPVCDACIKKALIIQQVPWRAGGFGLCDRKGNLTVEAEKYRQVFLAKIAALSKVPKSGSV